MGPVDLLLYLMESYFYLLPLAGMLLFFLRTHNQLDLPRVGGSSYRPLKSKATHQWLHYGREMLEDGYRRVSKTRI